MFSRSYQSGIGGPSAVPLAGAYGNTLLSVELFPNLDMNAAAMRGWSLEVWPNGLLDPSVILQGNGEPWPMGPIEITVSNVDPAIPLTVWITETTSFIAFAQLTEANTYDPAQVEEGAIFKTRDQVIPPGGTRRLYFHPGLPYLVIWIDAGALAVARVRSLQDVEHPPAKLTVTRESAGTLNLG